MRKNYFILSLLLAVFSFVCKGQEVLLMGYETTYYQDFNSLPTGSGSELAGEWKDGETLPGFYLYSVGQSSSPVQLKYTNVNSTWKSDSTAVGGAAGSFASLGYDYESDRALGSFINNALGNVYIGIKIKNADEDNLSIKSLKITYTGEQWTCSHTITQDLIFSYKVNATSIADNDGWTVVEDLKFTSPSLNTIKGKTKYINGNEPENRIEGITATINVNVPAGEVVWLRWYDFNDESTDHILAIDDLEVEATFGDNSSINKTDIHDRITVRNLSKDRILVGSEEELKQIEVYNSLGQLSTIIPVINDREKELELAGFVSGIYYLKVTTVDNNTQTLKIMK